MAILLYYLSILLVLFEYLINYIAEEILFTIVCLDGEYCYPLKSSLKNA